MIENSIYCEIFQRRVGETKIFEKALSKSGMSNNNNSMNLMNNGKSYISLKNFFISVALFVFNHRV